MTRRTYRYCEETGEMIELTAEHQRPSKKGALNHLGSLWGDRHYDGMRSTDGADISSRKKHRDYMRKMGYTTADDYKSSWAKAQRERENYMQKGGSVRRQDISAAIERLTNRR